MNRLFLFSFLFLAGCNSQKENAANNDKAKDSTKENTTTAITTSPNIDGCYIFILKKDTANLKINIKNSQVSGNLTYNHFEKDGNVGIIKGKFQDSLIIADYTFQSEGITSVREVVFKISGENLIEGYGDIIINKNGDTARFKNPSQLKFQDNQPFVKEDCK